MPLPSPVLASLFIQGMNGKNTDRPFQAHGNLLTTA